jgi:DNA polymerase-3 subunit epsilon
MQDFIAIDFETGNPQRVSACALGYARVQNGLVVESKSFLIKPVGGHSPFQSKIHGIKEEHTFDKPDFGELFPDIKGIFVSKLVAHSLFDKQVMCALSEYFDLSLEFDYYDTSSLAKQLIPSLKDHKLKTLAKHFSLPKFQHHDAKEDAIACANVCLKLHETQNNNKNLKILPDENSVFRGLIQGILADDEVNYKEAYSLLYWLQDNKKTKAQYSHLFSILEEYLGDNDLSQIEAETIKRTLALTIQELVEK